MVGFAHLHEFIQGQEKDMERFTTFDGRIGRQEWWIGIGIMFVIAIVLMVITGFIFGDGFFGRLVQLIVSLVMLALFAGVSVRRLHDRNKAANPWLIIFVAPSLLYNVMNLFGIGFTRIEFMGVSMLTPGFLARVVMFASAVVGIWALVELGILKGTDGGNDFGPDPLQ
jgi:uncharacterized membrane protein YhaH (DUF805 family)